jgi:hypothetical protein
VRLFLLTLHIVLAGGVLYGVALRPDAFTLPGALLLVILAGICAGLWNDQRWAAMPAGALAFGTLGTAVLLLINRAGTERGLLLRIVLALLAVVIVEGATLIWALRRRSTERPSTERTRP